MNCTDKFYNISAIIISSILISGCENPFTSDEEAPLAIITFPPDGSTVTGTVSVSVDASDNEGVTKVEFYIDGQLKETDTESPWLYDWNTKDYANGKEHTIFAKAHDKAGNSDTTSSSLITVLVGIPVLSVSPIELMFGDSLTQLVFAITDSGVDTVSWQISTEDEWLSLSPLSGSTFGETDIIKVTVDRTNLEPGNYIGLISVKSNGGDQDISVSIRKNSNPILSITPQLLDFGDTVIQEFFVVKNVGNGLLMWTVETEEIWIAISQSTGSTSTESDTIYLTVNRTGLTSSNYVGNISVQSNGGKSNISVSMDVIDPAILTVTPTAIDFGSNETLSQISISNSGGDKLTWEITEELSWITVSPDTGSTTLEIDKVNIIADRENIDPGVHVGFLSVKSNGGVQDISISISRESDPILEVWPLILNFGGTDSLLYFSISNLGSGLLSWSVTDTMNWLTMSPVEGVIFTESDTVKVVVSRFDLTSDNYTGRISITSDGGGTEVLVEMIVP